MMRLKDMPKKMFSCLVRLQRDESGTVMVFFCVVAVVLFVFLLSVLNVGVVANDKIDLQNAADFSILSASTWEARAMNMEALFNNTISAGVVLQVAHSLMTGVEPVEMPPAWIRLQESAQRWIQDSFNTYSYPDSSGTRFAGFGSWMAAMTSEANGDYGIQLQALNSTSTEPETEGRIPLYVYRYRFFDQEPKVNPILGAEDFVERTKPYLPNTNNLSQGNGYYRVTSTPTPPSDSVPEAPKDSGYIVWEHTMTFQDESSEPIWPKDSDLVHIFSSGERTWDSGTAFSSNFVYNLIDDLNLSPEDQIKWANKLKDHITTMIDNSDVSRLAVYNTDSIDIKTYLKNYVKNNLAFNPGSPDFNKLFIFQSNGTDVSLKIPYPQDKESLPPSASNTVHGHLVLRIVPEVTVGVTQNDVKYHFVDENDGTNINDAPNKRYAVSELKKEGHQPSLRYYDKGKNRELWFKPSDTYSGSTRSTESKAYTASWQVPEKRTRTISDGMGGSYTYTYTVMVTKSGTFYEHRRRITLPDGNNSKATGWYHDDRSDPTNGSPENMPSAREAFDTLWGTSYTYYYKDDRNGSHYYDSDFSNVMKRKWYYYSFGVQFDVTIKAYLNIDFSTMLMAKYTRSTDPLQLGSSEGQDLINASTAKFIDAYKNQNYKRISSCRTFRDVQPLPFGRSFFQMPYSKLPDTLDEVQKTCIAQGVIPPIYAFSAARAWQKDTNGNDESDSGGGVADIIFKMNWHSKQVNLPSFPQTPSTPPQTP